MIGWCKVRGAKESCGWFTLCMRERVRILVPRTRHLMSRTWHLWWLDAKWYGSPAELTAAGSHVQRQPSGEQVGATIIDYIHESLNYLWYYGGKFHARHSHSLCKCPLKDVQIRPDHDLPAYPHLISTASREAHHETFSLLLLIKSYWTWQDRPVESHQNKPWAPQGLPLFCKIYALSTIYTHEKNTPCFSYPLYGNENENAIWNAEGFPLSLCRHDECLHHNWKSAISSIGNCMVGQQMLWYR